MKKILSSTGIGSLTLALLIAFSFTSVSASSVQSSASETSTSIETQDTYFRFVEIARYTLNFPQETINYNQHGYSGTLNLVDWDFLGDRYLGIYQGYVQCTGVCMLATETEE